MPVSWKDIFKSTAGYTPESVGISDEETANNHLQLLQSMRSMSPAVVPNNNSTDSAGGQGSEGSSNILKSIIDSIIGGSSGGDSIGTRNESIYPTQQ